MNDAIKLARLQNEMKNSTTALVLGFLIPGAGQMYAGSVGFGIINFVLIVVLAVTIVASPIAFILYVLSMYWGYKGVLAFNNEVIRKAESQES
uniref:TM2 domain containing protein n=1 Tax=Shewanella sp. (strain MR-7) TaxID=60481 RepID=Q0HW90_SHESR